MAKMTMLSTNISFELKQALNLFCKRKGLKIQSVVENALREQLDDEADLVDFLKRSDEEEIPLSKVLKNFSK